MGCGFVGCDTEGSDRLLHMVLKRRDSKHQLWIRLKKAVCGNSVRLAAVTAVAQLVSKHFFFRLCNRRSFSG